MPVSVDAAAESARTRKIRREIKRNRSPPGGNEFNQQPRSPKCPENADDATYTAKQHALYQ
jgi:hypothetical protein